MSQNKEMIDDVIEYLETSIQEGLEDAKFIKNFRERIEKYIEVRLS